MPRLEFDSVKNGTNVRKHGISLDRFGDMDFDAALVDEDVTHSTATETCWIYLGPIDGVLYVGNVTYRGDATRVISLRRASRPERKQSEQTLRRP
jgi:uncharacterized DUF497 family protein